MRQLLLTLVLSILTTSASFSQVTADFSFTFNTTCEVAFTDLSTGSPTSWSWDFGPNTQGNTINNPTHLFLPGTHSVKLIVSDGTSTDSIIKQVIVAEIPFAIHGSKGPNCCDTLTVTPSSVFVNWCDGSIGHTHITCPPFFNGIFCASALDPNGCWGSDTILLPLGLGVLPTITHPTCDNTADGSIFLNPDTTNGPVSILWDNGDTTASRINLRAGTYTVVLTNANCSDSLSYTLRGANLGLSVTSTEANCDGTGATATVTATGGTAPYSYSWTNGDLAPTASFDSVAGYTVYVTDAAGCVNHRPIIPQYADTCFSVVRGKVYLDYNKNCVQDMGEPGVPYIPFKANNSLSTYTNITGQFAIHIFKADTFQLFPNLASISWPITGFCPPSGSYQVIISDLETDTAGFDFGIQADTLVDLAIRASGGRFRPGFRIYSYLNVINKGTILSAAPTVSWEHNADIDFLGATPAPASYDSMTRTAVWNLSPLAVLHRHTIRLHVRTDQSVPLGTVIPLYATVTPVIGDSVPANNFDTLHAIVQGAYDPNDKQVEPIGDIGPDQETLIYTVRFQNTGTDTAFYVVIRDTIDANLDPFSFQTLTASHPFDAVIEEDSILVFTFANILLPDSNVNEPESHGHIQFSLNLQDSLVSSQIDNRAAIYFDFNEPIITNTVTNFIAIIQCICGPDGSTSLRLYPNPTTGEVTIADPYGTNSLQSIEVFDLSGKRMDFISIDDPTDSFSWDLRNYPAGIYLIRAMTADGPATGKLVKE